MVQALSIQARSEGGWAVGRKATNKGANKGKVLMLSSFTMDYGPDISSRKPTIVIGMRFKATDQAFQDCQLIGELARMVMLPID